MIHENKYTIPYTVPSSALDGKYRCTPLVFASLAQDLAAHHYSSEGLLLPNLHKLGATWIISKQHFEIYEYPLWMDTLVLQTWAQPAKGFFCFRDFAYHYAAGGKKSSVTTAFSEFREAGQIAAGAYQNTPEMLCNYEHTILRGSSCWLVLNMETGQPIVPDKTILGGLTFCSDHLSGRVFAKIPQLETRDREEYFRPSLLDIDMNEHVNNLNYIRWILSYMEADFCRGKLLRVLDTNFLLSAKYGDDLCCRCAYTDANVCIHSIVRKTDEAELFRARTEWADEQQLSRPLIVDTE